MEFITPKLADDEKNFDQSVYLNTKYKTERINKSILNIDSGSIDATDTPSPTEFNLTLDNPFRIDKKSDIYIDSFTTFKCENNTGVNRLGFLFSIDQFNNNNSYSNTSNIHNKIFIPNESTDEDTPTKSFIHKGKKLNYVGTINPCDLTKLDITLTDLASNCIFDTALNNCRFLMELIFIETNE